MKTSNIGRALFPKRKADDEDDGNKKKTAKTVNDDDKSEEEEEEPIEVMNLSEAWAASQKAMREGSALLREFKVKVDSLVDSYEQQNKKVLQTEKKCGKLEKKCSLYEEWLRKLDPNLSKCPLPLMHILNGEDDDGAVEEKTED